ncbi:hypothetical protein [Rhodovarius crocodyli]|uniref:hypothetical protein n=1 Tax=Rhodovarius crocodyli TaxID=1979269 RepID=UPI0013E33030|nr:hypothetical protein [Rhodovarius crocodyli]
MSDLFWLTDKQMARNNATSKVVFEWIAGFERGDAEEGERAARNPQFRLLAQSA